MDKKQLHKTIFKLKYENWCIAGIWLLLIINVIIWLEGLISFAKLLKIIK